MSGPKTSQLEIERMIRAQLEALRSDVDHGRAQARRRITTLRDELLGEAEGCAEADEAATSLRHLAEAALAQLADECAFEPAAAMEDSADRAERCTARAAAIADAFEREARPVAERIRRVRAQAAAASDAQGFAVLLAQVAEEDAAETAVETARSLMADEHSLVEGNAEAPTTPDQLQAVAQRALALIASPCALPADRALLLETTRDLGREVGAQLALLLPTMESNAEAMADLVALIEDAEADLRAQGISFTAAPCAFATLEEAADRLEALRALQLQADRNVYLRACIDAVMERHGYTIARSVTMGQDLAGAHRLFGQEGATEGLHAFVSDAGDLMLQVAGLPEGIDAVENGEVVAMEEAPAGARTERLLADQCDFCAVYDEIADDLAAFGITNTVRYRAAADTAFCREMRAVAESETQTETAASQTTQRKRKRGGNAAREMR